MRLRRNCAEFIFKDFQGCEGTSEEIKRDAVQLERQLDVNMDGTDVDEMSASHAELMCNEDPSELQRANGESRD
jgi:hypothetical protein